MVAGIPFWGEEAVMPTKNTHNDRRPTARDDARREGTDLDRRYGRIGISAVAAAARYHGEIERKALASLSSDNDKKRDKVLA
jgi:hypothetical protein